jgi:hypothetical protein
MTKVVKWWKRISFWNKLRSILTALGAGGEVALIIGESSHSYKYVVGIATVVMILITHLIEDRNNNGIADIFEKSPFKKK